MAKKTKKSKSRESRVVVRPNRLRELRMQGQILSQEAVAAIVGLDKTTVNAHENGRRAITMAVAKRYANVYTGGEVVLLFNPPDQLEAPKVCECCGRLMIEHRIKGDEDEDIDE